MSIPLAALEAIVDASRAAPAIEALLPAGVRDRQLTARTLLTGMLLVLDDRRPAFLTEVHAALIALPQPDQARLGVTVTWKTGPHQLTYRQVEHTHRLVAKALSKDSPDGAPSDDLQAVCDRLLEASIPARHKQAPRSLAADWTDVESWSRPPRHGTTECADPEAHWGHRTVNLPGPNGELFYGWYLSIAVMVRDENGPPAPELARRMTVCSCARDPARVLAAVLLRMPQAGTPLGDIIDDSGYAHRDAEAWAIPLRRAGAQLVQDLHPHDRGPRGTHQGAVIANGSLYCPQTPRTLLELAPLPPAATAGQTAVHDQQTAELARYKLGRHTADDTDGYHRAWLPRRGRQDPLPAPPGLDAAQPGPARDPHPARAPARLLHPAHHHRPAPGRGQDTPETRLPIRGLAAVLPAAHQRRTSQRHHQRPRQQQHRPRLVPAHGPDPHHAMDRLPARHPQPAHRRSIPGPPGRQRPPRRRRATAPHPQTPAHHPRRPCRRAAITSTSRPPRATATQPINTNTRRPAPRCPQSCTSGKPRTRHPHHDHQNAGEQESRTQM